MNKQMNEAQKTSPTLTGRVVSNKMDKTIAVLVQRTVKHPIYEKFMRRSTKVLAHDEHNECNEGDVVLLESSRPVSRRKAWRLQKVLTRTQAV